jgi:hypothetical protein
MEKTGILKCSPSICGRQKYALIEFQEEIQGENLLIRCDNATVVAYINKQGGTKSIPLCLLLWDMMQWCLKHNNPNPTWMHLSTELCCVDIPAGVPL